ALYRPRRVECPQPPTPHPSGDRPWLHWRRGLPLWVLIEPTVSATTRRLRSRVRARSPCGAGVGAGVGGSLYSSLFGTKPGAVSVHLPIASRGDLRYARPTTRLSRCTISARPPKPRIERMSADARPLILAASWAS